MTSCRPEPQPAGECYLEVRLEDAFTAAARIAGKSYRKTLKAIDANGPEAMTLILQGTLKPPNSKGSPFVIEGAGISVQVNSTAPSPKKYVAASY